MTNINKILLTLAFLTCPHLMAKSNPVMCQDMFSNTWDTSFMDIRQLDENISSSKKSSALTVVWPLQSLRLGPGHIVTYHYSPAQEGKKTFVLLNGLIYDLKNWQEYVQELTQQGYGVLLVGYSTQPESIAQLDDGEVPFFALKNNPNNSNDTSTSFLAGLKLDYLETDTLANEVLSVADHIGLNSFHVVSLSYSSMVGQFLAQNFSDRVESVIFMAPAVRPANRYHLYGESRHQFYAWKKLWNMNPFYDPDYYYDLELLNSMYPIIYAQYAMNKGIDSEFSHFFAGVYQKARSVKWFDLKDLAEEDLQVPIHLFLAEREDAPLLQDQELFWQRLQSNPTFRGQRVMFERARHALPSDNPQLAAEWTIKVTSTKD
jgi:pimeloyl-ACP methyl ester carboxylesterase